MHVSVSSALRDSGLNRLVCLTAPGLLCLCGCMNPGMPYGGYPNYGYQNYAQPGYSPPQMLNQAPGSLYIPPSSAPAYDPSQTYESNPGTSTDSFSAPSGDPRFFPSDDAEGGVPTPRGFEADRDLGTQYSPGPNFDSRQPMPRPSSIQPVSATSAPVEYGFDTENYRWLRGVLRHDQATGTWRIEYSPAARDKYRGQFFLTGAAQMLDGFRDGDMADIHGHIDPNRTDATGRPLYQFDNIVRISM
ncbi:MAG: hypothetical protein R3C59_11405 [Planctomycetaceae bacterium]